MIIKNTGSIPFNDAKTKITIAPGQAVEVESEKVGKEFIKFYGKTKLIKLEVAKELLEPTAVIEAKAAAKAKADADKK